MAVNDGQPRLGCGRIIDDVWASIDQPLTAHEQNCPDCLSARTALHHLVEVTDAMRERDRNDAALQPSSRVKDAIMMVARAEVRRSRRTPLASTTLGVIDISDQALNALIRFAASTLPGVHARRCTITNAPGSSDSAAPVNAADVRIKLTVALSSAVRIPATMSLLRERIMTIVEAQTSITMQQIDVVVEDLYDI